MLGDEYRPVWWEGTEEYAVNPGKVRFRIIPTEPPTYTSTHPSPFVAPQIGILLVGGGGGGWKGCCGARSGHVKYKTFTVTKNHTRVVMTVGRGGYGGYDGESGAGQISEVYIDKDGPDQQYWSVNGGML